VWVETVDPLTPAQATALLGEAPGLQLVDTPTPRDAAQTDRVLVGRVRDDLAAERNGLVLFLACDNLVKGAALNAIQIAELVLQRVAA
jgi:aspartate-semialdehyde dehydrogenase